MSLIHNYIHSETSVVFAKTDLNRCSCLLLLRETSVVLFGSDEPGLGHDGLVRWNSQRWCQRVVGRRDLTIIHPERQQLVVRL